MVFLHANGYPPECYRILLQAMATKYHVTAMHLRPLWPGSQASDLDSWHPLSEDFLRFLHERSLTEVIAVGHSMGAIVALRAALSKPAFFRALILLDPVLMGRCTILKWQLLRSLGGVQFLQPRISWTRQRRRVFVDLEQAFRAYHRRAVFQSLSDANLRTMIEGLTAPLVGGGYSLRYSPEWEARIYETAVWRDWDLWKGIPGFAVPLLIIHGEHSDTFPEIRSRDVRTANPRIRSRSVKEATHLVPLEKPTEVFSLIDEFLTGVLSLPAAAATEHRV